MLLLFLFCFEKLVELEREKLAISDEKAEIAMEV